MSQQNIVGSSGEAFTGAMRHLLSQADPKLLAGSGNQVIGTSVMPVLTNPAGGYLGILQSRWTDALPRCIQLAFPASSPGPATAYPPPAASQALGAGVVDAFGVVGSPDYLYLAAVIEYGCGSAAQKMFCDWKPGAINLPASDFVSISALMWGNPALAPAALSLQGAVSTHTVDGTHVPTASGQVAMLAGVTRSFLVPAAARAVGVTVADASRPIVQIDGAAYAYFDYPGHTFVPSAAVLELLNSATLTVTTSINCLLNLVWYLQP